MEIKAKDCPRNGPGQILRGRNSWTDNLPLPARLLDGARMFDDIVRTSQAQAPPREFQWNPYTRNQHLPDPGNGGAIYYTDTSDRGETVWRELDQTL